MLRRASFLGERMRYDPANPAGYRVGRFDLTEATGAQALAVKAFELPAGQSVCPYHYEYEEEWLAVLDGSVRVRTPEGEETLQRGEVVRFPAGPAGAHKVSNAGEPTARVLMFSSARKPAVAVYPDSDKIGVWPDNADDEVMLRREDGAVGYWEREPASE